MPAQFDQPGLSFAYPENWRVEAPEEAGPLRSVTVLAPGTGYWTVSVHPIDSSPAALVDAVVSAMQEEYTELEVEEVCGAYAGREMAGCDMRFHYLDLTNTASLRWFREPGGLYLLMWQAEDVEYDALTPVFGAMAVSLIRGLAS
jgi:hypothetical protein